MTENQPDCERVKARLLLQDNGPDWYKRCGLTQEEAAEIARQLREECVGWGSGAAAALEQN